MFWRRSGIERELGIDGVDEFAQQVTEVVVDGFGVRVLFVRIEVGDVVFFDDVEFRSEHEAQIVDGLDPCGGFDF